MNDAKLTFTVNELAVLTAVVGHAADQPIRGIGRLRETLKHVEPGQVHYFAATEIAAADEAFGHVATKGYMPAGLTSEEQDAFHRVKGMIAAAAVD